MHLRPDDFEIERTEHLTRSSTVLMLDLSLSMPMRDNFLPAKKVAMALHSLISSQFPRDYLGIVGFSETARVLTAEQLPEVSWDFVYGTNMQHGFMLARQLLARQTGTKQIIMITDGEPTAHITPSGDVFFNYPPVPRDRRGHAARGACAAPATASASTRSCSTPTSYLKAFIEQLTEINRGRAFFTTPETLGDYVLVDFIEHKRQQARGRQPPPAATGSPAGSPAWPGGTASTTGRSTNVAARPNQSHVRTAPRAPVMKKPKLERGDPRDRRPGGRPPSTASTQRTGGDMIDERPGRTGPRIVGRRRSTNPPRSSTNGVAHSGSRETATATTPRASAQATIMGRRQARRRRPPVPSTAADAAPTVSHTAASSARSDTSRRARNPAPLGTGIGQHQQRWTPASTTITGTDRPAPGDRPPGASAGTADPRGGHGRSSSAHQRLGQPTAPLDLVTAPASRPR